MYKWSFKGISISWVLWERNCHHLNYCCCLVIKLCSTLVTPWIVACQAPLHGIFQVRILDWVAISFFRGSSQSRNQIIIFLHSRWSPALQADSLPLSHQGSTTIYIELGKTAFSHKLGNQLFCAHRSNFPSVNNSGWPAITSVVSVTITIKWYR